MIKVKTIAPNPYQVNPTYQIHLVENYKLKLNLRF